MVNRSETNALTADLVLKSGEYTGSTTVEEINAESVTSTNTRTNEAVAIATREIQFSGHDIKYIFPPHSFTQMLIPIK